MRCCFFCFFIPVKSIKPHFSKVVPVVDGKFDGDEVYNECVTDFVKIKPLNSEIPSGSVKVYCVYDSLNIYIFFGVYQRDEIISSTVRRDHDFSLDDWVEVVISPFGESKESYSFMVNPQGTMWDAHFTEDGAGGGKEWDGEWECRTRINKEGWNAEFCLPFRLFKYSARDTIWRINFYRYIKKRDELDSWADIEIERNRYRVSRFGYLIIHPPGRKIKVFIAPYISYLTSHKTFRGGVDVKTIFFSRFSISGVYKPDFCQVEPDVDKINLSKETEIHLPEKRPFFLEDFGAFDMDIPVFYTRRIVDFDQGIKLSTHLKKIKAVSFFTRYDSLHQTIEGVRIKGYGVLCKFLDAGGMVIDYRDNSLREISYAGDMRISLLKNTNLSLNYAWIKNDTIDGFPNALEVWFSHAIRCFSLSLGYKDYSINFNPILGFVSRNDIKGPVLSAGYRIYPSRDLMIKTSMLFNGLRNHDGERVLYGWRGSLEIVWYNSYGIYLYNNRFGHRYGEDYFQNNFYDGGIFCDIGDRVSLAGGFAAGDFYGGKMEYPYLSIFFHPASNINISLSLDYSKVDYGGNAEEEWISVLKCEYQIFSFLSIRLFYQQHFLEEEKEKVLNSLIKIKLSNSSTLYLVYDKENEEENIYFKGLYEWRW